MSLQPPHHLEPEPPRPHVWRWIVGSVIVVVLAIGTAHCAMPNAPAQPTPAPSLTAVSTVVAVPTAPPLPTAQREPSATATPELPPAGSGGLLNR